MKASIIPFKLFVLVVTLSCQVSSGQWTKLTPGTYSNLTLEDIHVSVTGDTLIAVGTAVADNFTGHTLFSYDGGLNWDTTRYNSGYGFKGIAFASPNVGVIAALGGIGCALRTTDGGATWAWNWCDQNYSGVYDINFINSTDGYMAGYGHSQFDDGNVYKTTDAGQSWVSISGAIPNKPFEFIEVADQNVLYGGSYLFLNRKLHRSIDGGASWDSIDVTATTNCNDLHFHSAGEGILAGGNGIYRTTDSANTWIKVGHFPAHPNLNFSTVAFINANEGWVTAVDANGTASFVSTVDGGKTWTLSNSTLPNARIIKTRAFGRRVYAVSNDGNVFASPNSTVGLEEFSDLRLKISPNPVSEFTTISWNDIQNKRAKLFVYDISGQEVEVQMEISEHEIKLTPTSIKPGIYSLVLQFEDGTVVTEKVVVIK